MVLADDNFATIVGAVSEGRRIYDNIRKAIQFLLASNMSEVISIFVATLLGFTILHPVHLLWINLVTDCFPALALGMEKAEPDVMKRKPRAGNEGIFADGLGIDILWEGAVISALTLISFFIGNTFGEGYGMTFAFVTLSIAEITQSFNLRSRTESVFRLKGHNKYLWLAMGVSFALTTLITFVPFLRTAFSFSSITVWQYALAFAIGILMLPVAEAVKIIHKKHSK